MGFSHSKKNSIDYFAIAADRCSRRPHVTHVLNGIESALAKPPSPPSLQPSKPLQLLYAPLLLTIPSIMNENDPKRKSLNLIKVNCLSLQNIIFSSGDFATTPL